MISSYHPEILPGFFFFFFNPSQYSHSHQLVFLLSCNAVDSGKPDKCIHFSLVDSSHFNPLSNWCNERKRMYLQPVSRESKLCCPLQHYLLFNHKLWLNGGLQSHQHRRSTDLKARLKKWHISNNQYLPHFFHGPDTKIWVIGWICILGWGSGEGRRITQGIGQGYRKKRWRNWRQMKEGMEIRGC